MMVGEFNFKPVCDITISDGKLDFYTAFFNCLQLLYVSQSIFFVFIVDPEMAYTLLRTQKIKFLIKEPIKPVLNK